MGTPSNNRRSIRLQGYDYTSPGAYFITICTYNHVCILWEDREDKILLSHSGIIARYAWQDLPNHNPNLLLDEFCIMPNHIHGILQITADKPDKPIRLSEIVRGFKSFTARRINGYRQTPGVSVWQRNYYEHIIRNNEEWSKIRDYISLNPKNWKDDQAFKPQIYLSDI